MKQSSVGEVRELYEDSADSYAAMMDAEIDLPIYAEVLGQLSAKLAARSGALVDTSCGSGHMLSMYRERYDSERPLLGIDLSPRMVEIASARFGGHAEILVGDMRDLSMVGTDSAAAIISFYSLHHLDPEGVSTALREWHRVLQPGGQLLVAAWEGTGVIDYGEASDVVALRYRSAELVAWAQAAGFTVTRERVEPVEGMEMDAVFLQGAKA